MTWRIFFFIRFKYFCLVPKMKIEIIKVKYQTFFLTVWLGPPILKTKIFIGLWRSLKILKLNIFKDLRLILQRFLKVLSYFLNKLRFCKDLFEIFKISSKISNIQSLNIFDRLYIWYFEDFIKFFCKFFSVMFRLNIFGSVQILHWFGRNKLKKREGNSISFFA